jgi:CrcB protein
MVTLATVRAKKSAARSESAIVAAMDEQGESVGIATQLVGVFVAGGAGAVLRVVLSNAIDASWSERLPFAGTLVVNLLGCLVIGIAAAVLSATHWRTIVLGGLLGGFTTYSAFALFSVTLGEGQRWGMLAGQIAAHVIGGIVCVCAGFWLARTLGVAH